MIVFFIYQQFGNIWHIGWGDGLESEVQSDNFGCDIQ
jgi:hypothetical protein